MTDIAMSDPQPDETDEVGIAPEDEDAANPPDSDADAGIDDGDPALDEEV